ncbi:hypothetical protein NYR60_05215 [Actinobacillus genomosp. 2]|uniref:hypothetical protein n=1 Tax=Actinobacillus genomosp. 2 TaxID=230709 RepID=UPI0024423141|nr:hypothetical protein [Actinobacillus genomosp. 2]WGE31277.1 hypothetical protein NYR60_05215 [Actinobacillus genomosp. 2]
MYIQYNSFPESAKLVCENSQSGFQDFGYTPTTLRYDIPEQGVQIGFVQTPLCKAIWVSGAEAEYQNRYAVQSNYGSYTNTVSNKKATATDIQFDAQRKYTAAMQAQARAIRAQASAIRDASSSQQSFGFGTPFSTPKITYCNQYGSMTNCRTY